MPEPEMATHDAMNSINCVLLDRCVLGGVEDEAMVGGGERQPHRSGAHAAARGVVVSKT
jgi:hypothetical protein